MLDKGHNCCTVVSSYAFFLSLPVKPPLLDAETDHFPDCVEENADDDILPPLEA
jgi:hypothetical protein